MPAVKCPISDCDYETPDLDPVIVAALITAHTTEHSRANSNVAAARVEKVKRPTISSAGTSEDWTYFISRWNDYAEATKVTGKDRIVQLLECCDEQLRKDLTRSATGSLTDKTQQEVLKAIKTLAVREENAMVSRVALNNMRQDRDEPIRSFGARLRGQAGVCKYTIECHHCQTENNYTDIILRDVLCRGLYDTEIQLDLLGDMNQEMTLEETFQFVEAKEAGKRSASRLLESQGAEYVSSSYRQLKKSTLKDSYQNKSTSNESYQNKPDMTKICSYCGKKGHGQKAPARKRQEDCPAFNHTCKHCNIPHHYDSMCRRKNNPKKSDENEGAIFDSLCAMSAESITHARKRELSLGHHLYSAMNDMWTRQASQPQPFINLTAKICAEDYDCFNFKLPSSLTDRQISIPAMADTGCQSCLIGIKHINQLGLKKEDLIPVKIRMHAANNKGISILGAIILRLSGRSPSSNTIETRQITYVTDNSDKLFISKEACISLGMITDRFPTIGEANLEHSSAIAEGSKGCNCPERTLPPPIPLKLPLPPTEENREALQEFLLDYYKSSTFNTCEHQPLPLMEGPPLELMVDTDAIPVAVHTPVPVPIHWQEEVKAGLDRDVRLGVIEPVPIGEPVTWCHRMVICAKKTGKPRRTVDLQPLNAHAKRETHHTQSPFHQARSVPQQKKKTVTDAWNGYHSVPLREEDRHYTTFITPWGRYRYCTTPQGYISSGDGYSRRFDEIVANVQKKTKCIDDTLLWEDDIEKSFFQACSWLDLCGRHGIIQNPEKFIFASDVVEFAGFEITTDSVRPCRRYIQAITEFPVPRNITDIRSWFGLVNQVAYTFSMKEEMLPFRNLLKPKVSFYWDQTLNSLFEESKKKIVNAIEDGVRIFDKSKQTCLATDWSKTGIGFWLFQKHCQCIKNVPFCCPTGWKVSLVGSRFTSGAESRYAPIEGEALAVVDALEKARHFVLGCKNLVVAVDHKPLLKVFGDRSLEDIPNPRLENLKEKTLRFRFTMLHIPGIKHKAPDAISRYPSGDINPSGLLLKDDASPGKDDTSEGSHDVYTSSILHRIRQIETESSLTEGDLKTMATSTLDSLQAVTWERVRVATNSDESMRKLVEMIENGLPERRQEYPEELQEYFQFRESLYTIDGVAVYKERIIIPPSLRGDILKALHSAHQGVTSMMSRAESSIFWPGITKAINLLRSACYECNRMAPSQPSAPPTPLMMPEYPFQCLCSDFFQHKGSHYLICVDRYSNWPIVKHASGGSDGLIKHLRRTFATYGIPDELASDGGPEYTATAMQTFLKNWGVHHRLSSVAFAHSNCRAEIGVKTVRRMIAENTGSHGELDTDGFQRAILQYRNCPDPDTKLSPAMCLFGRPVKDFIPILPGKYLPHDTWQDMLMKREEALRNRHMRSAERLSEHTVALPPLAVGDQVRIQNQRGPDPRRWDKTGSVIEVKQFDQYVVRTDGSGRITLRNRKFLRKFIPVVLPRQPLQINDDIVYKRKTSNVQLRNGPQRKEMTTNGKESEGEAHLPQIAPTDGTQESGTASKNNVTHQDPQNNNEMPPEMKNTPERDPIRTRTTPSPLQQATTPTVISPSDEVPPIDNRFTVSPAHHPSGDTDVRESAADVPALRPRRWEQRRVANDEALRASPSGIQPSNGEHELLQPRRSKREHKPPARFNDFEMAASRK